MLNADSRFEADQALIGSMRDFRELHGKDLMARVDGFYEWQHTRRRHGLWPYSKATEQAPLAVCTARDDSGVRFAGLNFATQDYLGLSSDPEIKEVAKAVIDEYGIHSAGSSALAGNTKYSLRLERTIAEFLGVEHTVLYPTGWAAGYGAIKGLVRPADHVVMDGLAHACLQEGAYSATANVHLHGHLNLESARRHLKRIRARDAENGILVVTESLFSMDSDTPDLRALQELCREYEATLLVDVAHDLGAMGEGGRGFIGQQGMSGQIDIVMGSFSKTFASNGGFVACNSPAVRQYLKFYGCSATFSNALVAGAGRHGDDGVRHRSIGQGAAAAAIAAATRRSDARRARRGRTAGHRRSVGHRAGAGRRRSAGADGQPAPAGARSDREPGGVPGRGQRQRPLPPANDADPQRRERPGAGREAAPSGRSDAG